MNTKFVAIALLMCLAFVIPASADIIPIISQGVATDPLETNTVAVPTQTGWNVPTGGATWVSDTGTTGAGSGPFPLNGYTATFTQTFILPYFKNVGSVTVWADDTADVLLDGALIYTAALNAPNGTCQMAVVGCLPQFGGVVDLTGLSAGSHVLSVTAHQVGGFQFGALWEGSVESTVPEPSSVVLLLSVVGVIGARVKRNRS